MRKETLIVDGWSSRCGNCGIDCDPNEKQHITNLGYNEELRKKKGCGVTWKFISSVYPNMKERLKEMRPDLKFTDKVYL